MLMTLRIHLLELAFFSVLIFAVHGAPTPAHPPVQKYSVTFFDEKIDPVLKLPVDVKEQLDKRLHGFLKERAPGKIEIQWNNVETTARPDGKQPFFNFMIQGGIFDDSPYPGFGWIQSLKPGDEGDFGSLFSHRPLGGGSRFDWFIPAALGYENEDGDKDGDHYREKFKATIMESAKKKWRSLLGPKAPKREREPEGSEGGGGKRKSDTLK
ncbi:hypothetical protein BDP27DRAFT_1362471 [Rhodocollybia butyracea]|uniref:Uncharacterized protein n=1 Tax=Rhodocollybia butyracea TaxID=206335 RepID=A0A9P5PR08_9AGAR|nr:hypothetical protein BDP27DRAFT_1362471 [Rhodocollybia butyracea]